MTNALATTLGRFTREALQTGRKWADIVKGARLDERADAAPNTTPKPAKPFVLTAEEESAIEDFVAQTNEVSWPAARRELSATERDRLLSFYVTYQTASKAVERAKAAIRTTFFNHLDVQAEKAGLANPEETPRDKAGHYLLPGDLAIEGHDYRMTREVSEPTVDLNADDLKALVDMGALPHETYLALTTQVRVVDEAKVMEAVRKDNTLLATLSHATRVTRAGSVSLNQRKA
jgi:hypothetical protein